MNAELHRWNLTPKEAIELQKNLAGLVKTGSHIKDIHHIAGVDIAFQKYGSTGYCGIIVFSFPDLKIVEERYYSDILRFPYVPGLLSFREGPIFLKAWELVRVRPDIIIFDGQGIAHPRRLGIASHMGLWLGIPSVGCAKSRLCGTYNEPGMEKGSVSELRDKDVVIGSVVRTRDRVRPVFVSPGHLIGLKESVEITLRCTDTYRIPVPTRVAHVRVGEYKRRMMGMQ